MVHPIDPASEQTFLENFTDEDNAAYILASDSHRRRMARLSSNGSSGSTG